MNIHITYPNIPPNAMNISVESLQTDNLRQATDRQIPESNKTTPHPNFDSEKESLRRQQIAANTPIVPVREGEQTQISEQQANASIENNPSVEEKQSSKDSRNESQDRRETPDKNARDNNNYQDEGQQNSSDDERREIEKRIEAAERAVIRQLQQIDAEVARHEWAHKVVGGRFTGAIRFDYETGPDGIPRRVGGYVPIDLSSTGDLKKDIQKYRQVQRAALAPASPSSQDLAVARQAASLERQAQQELRQQERDALFNELERVGQLISIPNIPSEFNPLAFPKEATATQKIQSDVTQRASVIASYYAYISKPPVIGNYYGIG